MSDTMTGPDESAARSERTAASLSRGTKISTKAQVLTLPTARMPWVAEVTWVSTVATTLVVVDRHEVTDADVERSVHPDVSVPLLSVSTAVDCKLKIVLGGGGDGGSDGGDTGGGDGGGLDGGGGSGGLSSVTSPFLT